MTTSNDDLLNHAIEQQEEDDAKELIEGGGLAFLPFDLQELYRDVVELYQLGRYADSSAAWELFKQMAHDKGMI